MKFFFRSIILVSILVLITGIAKSQSHQDSLQYQNAIKQADSAFNNKDFSRAKAFYENSLLILKGNLYATNKINECNIRIKDKELLDYQRATEAKYRAAIQMAEQAFVEDNITNAKNYYTQACALNPIDPYPKKRIHECDIWIKNKLINNQYQALLKAAFEKFKQSDFHGAKDAYQKALSLKPDSEFCKDNIERCNAELKKIHDTELKRLRYIAVGDSCMMVKDSANAITFYQNSLSIKEDCSVVKIVSLLTREYICCALETPPFSIEYLCAVNKGEFHMKLKNYAEAITAYEEALVIMPGEQYPKDQIKYCKRMMRKSSTK